MSCMLSPAHKGTFDDSRHNCLYWAESSVVALLTTVCFCFSRTNMAGTLQPTLGHCSHFAFLFSIINKASRSRDRELHALVQVNRGSAVQGTRRATICFCARGRVWNVNVRSQATMPVQRSRISLHDELA